MVLLTGLTSPAAALRAQGYRVIGRACDLTPRFVATAFAWCPVGIDVTAELNTLAREQGLPAQPTEMEPS